MQTTTTSTCRKRDRENHSLDVELQLRRTFSDPQPNSESDSLSNDSKRRKTRSGEVDRRTIGKTDLQNLLLHVFHTKDGLDENMLLGDTKNSLLDQEIGSDCLDVFRSLLCVSHTRCLSLGGARRCVRFMRTRFVLSRKPLTDSRAWILHLVVKTLQMVVRECKKNQWTNPKLILSPVSDPGDFCRDVLVAGILELRNQTTEQVISPSWHLSPPLMVQDHRRLNDWSQMLPCEGEFSRWSNLMLHCDWICRRFSGVGPGLVLFLTLALRTIATHKPNRLSCLLKQWSSLTSHTGEFRFEFKNKTFPSIFCENWNDIKMSD